MDPPPAPKFLPPSHSSSSLIHLFPTYPHPHPGDVIELPASSFPFSSSRRSAINRNHLNNNRSKRKRASTSQQPTTHVIQIDDDFDDDDEDDDDDDVVLISETVPSHKHKHKPNPKPRLALPTPTPTPSPISQLSSSYNYYASSSSSSSSLPLPLPTGSNFNSNPNPNPNPDPNWKPPSVASALDHFNFQDDDSDFDYDYDSDYDPLLLHDHTAFDFPVDPTFTLQPMFDGLDIPTGIEAPLPWFHKCFPTNKASSANASAGASASSLQHPLVLNHDDLDAHYNAFKQFDTVTDHTDHHFIHPKFNSSSHKPTKEWTKRIQNDWKLLQNDLPDSIFVRVYEDRMDLLRAVIIGPAGTPYHDGLFFFDVHFPPTYPHMPPMVHYNSGGLRLNPNLYACGKVCLSLLNTWSGSGCERWNPANSTMLQVLVSIQALVLNSKPYFNEPAYSVQANTPHGEQKSLAYNESTFLLSCKTMLYSLRQPPKHFEHFVAGHFRKRGYAILVACRAYMEGAQVGCLVGDGVQDVDEGDKSSSSSFKTSLKRIFEDLLMEFTVKGADCDEFLAQKRNQGTAAIPASQPSSATVTELSLGGPLFHL